MAVKSIRSCKIAKDVKISRNAKKVRRKCCKFANFTDFYKLFACFNINFTLIFWRYGSAIKVKILLILQIFGKYRQSHYTTVVTTK
jgi:hypothetical protein